MRNLVVFLVRHYFFLLFLFLEIIALYFLFRHNYFQHASAVSASNWFTGTLYQARTDLTDYLDLKDQNKLLSGRLAEELNKQPSSFMMYTTNTDSINDTLYRQRYEYLAAEVVDNTVTQRNNLIILNRGRLQGVEPDMGVVSAEGIVGIVREVSDNFCVVMSLLHKDMKVSASVKKDGTFGQLTWDGSDYREATLTDLPDHAKLAKGDTLITSGLGDAFPEGVTVGTIVAYEMRPGEKTWTVDVKLSTDFRKLKHTYIVKNLMRGELNQLRAKAEAANGK